MMMIYEDSDLDDEILPIMKDKFSKFFMFLSVVFAIHLTVLLGYFGFLYFRWFLSFFN